MASPRDTAAFLKTARKRFVQGQDASHNQRKRVLDDLAFYAGGDHQWDPETLKNRKAQQGAAGMPPVPARPCLTINKVREPVHQVLNQERQMDMGIQLVPADDWGELAPPVSDEEIELREGLVRRIQRESEAADARTWAFARAAIAGEGYYRVLTKYASGKTWDKEVTVARIFNQSSVTLDPAHEQPDGSDAEWGFIGGDVPWDRYKREHPKNAKGDKNSNAQADDSTFRALGEEYPGWFTQSGDTRSARVVEYFYTEWKNRTLLKLTDGQVLWEDELPQDNPELHDMVEDEREVPQKVIKWAKIDATQILEETDWEGPDLPIIKVVGEELQPFDKERRVEGMVRPARDSQQGYNAMISKWVESIGLAPIPPFQVAEGQVEGYEAWYQAANTRTLPYLPYRTHDLTDQVVGPPIRTNVDTPIQAIAASVQIFDEAIKSTTMVPSVQLGQAIDPHLKSGKAIQALQQQAQMGTSHLLDNLRRAIRYEGQIENNLLYPIYGRPGRLARMLTGENEPQTVRISAPAPPGAMMRGNAYAQPPAPAGPPGPPGLAAAPPGPAQAPGAMAGLGSGLPGGAPPPPPKQYILTKDANFNVIVKVTRNLDSRREEESSMIGNLVQQAPMFMSWFGDLWLKYQDGPGHDEMAERAEVMLDPKIQQMRTSKQQGMSIPPEIQAQMAAMKQQLDQAHQIMGSAQQELKNHAQQEQDNANAALQLARENNASKERIAQLDADNRAKDREVKLAVAELGAKVERLQLFVEERARVGDQQHEAALKAADAHHELKKLRITKTLMRDQSGALVGAQEDHEQVPVQ